MIIFAAFLVLTAPDWTTQEFALRDDFGGLYACQKWASGQLDAVEDPARFRNERSDRHELVSKAGVKARVECRSFISNKRKAAIVLPTKLS